MTKKCFIIDAMAVAHRFYYAHITLKNSDGVPTGVVYGTKGFIEEVIHLHKPDYLVVATDPKGGSFRNKLYEGYKANRKKKDDDFLTQLPYFYELFQHMNIPVLNIPDYEADDVIGSITKKFDSDDIEFYILSRDKDFMQLVRHNVFLLPDVAGPPVDINGVFYKTGLAPAQFIDYLAITGDSADNIPGVKGIGPKGAEKLLKAYGTLDGVYQNIHAIKDTYKKKLQKSGGDAVISKVLARIELDVEIPISLKDMTGYNTSSQEVWDLYEKLEIKY
jgi:DNA polymerase-1